MKKDGDKSEPEDASEVQDLFSKAWEGGALKISFVGLKLNRWENLKAKSAYGGEARLDLSAFRSAGFCEVYDSEQAAIEDGNDEVIKVVTVNEVDE